jgi:magnesium transporter
MDAQTPLLDRIRNVDPKTAAQRLADHSDGVIGGLLAQLRTCQAIEVLQAFPAERRDRIVAAAPFGQGQIWQSGSRYDDGTVGRLMEHPPAVFRPGATVREVTEALRAIVGTRMVTYVFVVGGDGRLEGVVAFRELLFAAPEQTLADVMIWKPFSLRAETALVDAMREVVTRHYPVYPVTDANDRLLGMVRGQALFEEQAFAISAQAGSMVGVEKEERLATPWPRSLRFRHPWLQLNLLTAFVAAAVVGHYQGTLDRLVVLAVFLPVLAGQSGNTGAQTLAVTLRGMTLGELRGGAASRLMLKEGLLGLLNGIGVGLIAGAAMFLTARSQANPDALALGLIVLAAMTVSCVISGAAGTAIPLVMKRLGADPATASSIFLSTATDVVSMGALLGLATFFLF